MSHSTPPVDSDAAAHLTAWLPELLYVNRRFVRGLALVSDDRTGLIAGVVEAEAATRAGGRIVHLPHRALLPGLVNAHSHSFQRVIRGRTEYRVHARDSFWTWREQMYAAAARLMPEDVYDAARMAFLEMLLGGITTVGEFHYLHHQPDGTPYHDPNLLAREVVRAARDVGLRIALLRVAYARAGWQAEVNPHQVRFLEPDAQKFIMQTDDLKRALAQDTPTNCANDATPAPAMAWIGIAPHSVRAVPLAYLREVCAYARAGALNVHMHVAEQPAEVEACVREHARTPVCLLADEGLLDSRFTAVHAVHVTPAEVHALARARAHVCACPTTERNLGDGIVPADLFFAHGVAVSLGSDSHTQIDLLEDARELEYHLRLQTLRRAVLVEGDDNGGDEDTDAPAALAARLFACATIHGASSLDAPGGDLITGRAADFFTVDLNDPSIAGADADMLLPAVVFSLARTAIRDAAVGGHLMITDGHHRAQDEIIGRFVNLQAKLWSK